MYGRISALLVHPRPTVNKHRADHKRPSRETQHGRRFSKANPHPNRRKNWFAGQEKRNLRSGNLGRSERYQQKARSVQNPQQSARVQVPQRHFKGRRQKSPTRQSAYACQERNRSFVCAWVQSKQRHHASKRNRYHNGYRSSQQCPTHPAFGNGEKNSAHHQTNRHQCSFVDRFAKKDTSEQGRPQRAGGNHEKHLCDGCPRHCKDVRAKTYPQEKTGYPVRPAQLPEYVRRTCSMTETQKNAHRQDARNRAVKKYLPRLSVIKRANQNPPKRQKQSCYQQTDHAKKVLRSSSSEASPRTEEEARLRRSPATGQPRKNCAQNVAQNQTNQCSEPFLYNVGRSIVGRDRTFRKLFMICV